VLTHLPGLYLDGHTNKWLVLRRIARAKLLRIQFDGPTNYRQPSYFQR
jgi:hypothetical protein